MQARRVRPCAAQQPRWNASTRFTLAMYLTQFSLGTPLECEKRQLHMLWLCPLPTSTSVHQTDSMGTQSKTIKNWRRPHSADVDNDHSVTFPVCLNPLRGAALAVASKNKHSGLIHGNPDSLPVVVCANKLRPTAGSKAVARIQVRSLAVTVAVEFSQLLFRHGSEILTQAIHKWKRNEERSQP